MMNALGEKKLVETNYNALDVLSGKHLLKCMYEGFSSKGQYGALTTQKYSIKSEFKNVKLSKREY